MLHAREDYNRIQDPENKIPEEEPVFIVRAQDVCAPDVMRFWAALHLSIGGDKKMYIQMMAHAKLAEEWQHKCGCKLADF